MKNRVIKLILLVVLVFCFAMLTGCIRDEIGISLSADGSGTYKYARYYNREAAENGNYNFDVEKESGEYDLKTINGEEYLGIVYTGEFKNIEELFHETDLGDGITMEITKDKFETS